MTTDRERRSRPFIGRYLHSFDPRSREGSDPIARADAPSTRGFDPRSREGSDAPNVTVIWPRRVSIHAPARGATRREGRGLPKSSVSIHAPARGATLNGCPMSMPSFCFDPRSREGSDCRYPGLSRYARCFDPRSREGSDAVCQHSYPDPLGFDPRSREGSDKGWSGFASSTSSFDPRSREGSDSAAGTTVVTVLCFDPRSREGSDIYKRWGAVCHTVSIHAPARGATPADFISASHALFRSTLPRGERRPPPLLQQQQHGFRSTLPRGERPHIRRCG